MAATRALVAAPAAPLPELMALVSQEFVAWLHDPTTPRRALGNACLAGALSGARLGPAPIPPDWLARLEDRAEIEALAHRLAQAKDRMG